MTTEPALDELGTDELRALMTEAIRELPMYNRLLPPPGSTPGVVQAVGTRRAAEKETPPSEQVLRAVGSSLHCLQHQSGK